ncbi:hypothetical protein GQ600_20277 [Phytophthora cactorum]|nr:hypothetical protein GQ600_20277 [Phytophthora cactorum]
MLKRDTKRMFANYTVVSLIRGWSPAVGVRIQYCTVSCSVGSEVRIIAQGARKSREEAWKSGGKEDDPVWIYQYGERKTKKLAFAWPGPYRIVGTVDEMAYLVAIPSHSNRVVTVKSRRVQPGTDDDGPLADDNLPSTSHGGAFDDYGQSTMIIFLLWDGYERSNLLHHLALVGHGGDAMGSAMKLTTGYMTSAMRLVDEYAHRELRPAYGCDVLVWTLYQDVPRNTELPQPESPTYDYALWNALFIVPVQVLGNGHAEYDHYELDDVRLASDCRSSVSWIALTWVAAVRWNKHAAQDHFWCRTSPGVEVLSDVQAVDVEAPPTASGLGGDETSTCSGA